MVDNRSQIGRALAAVAATVLLGVLLTGCTPSKEDMMTPHEARDALISTIKNTAALLDIPGWTLDGPAVEDCASDGSHVSYGVFYGAPQPGPDHDRHVDAKKVSDYWVSLGMTVRTVLDPDGDPSVYSDGGPVSGIAFHTAPGDYFFAGTSLCVPGDSDELVLEEYTE